MEFTDLKEMSECGENKSTDKFQHRKEKVKSTAPYVNTTIAPGNTSTIQNEDHEYEDLQQTTQLQSIKPTEEGLFKRIEKQLIYIVFVIQVMLMVAVVAIAVIISSSKSTQLDGSWNNWESWGQCSVACGYGMERRNRTCLDQTAGKHCFGDSAEYRICNNWLCQDQSNQKVDGGWCVWGPWSGCSASCGTGMESRNRTCSNPKPSNGGDYCFGESAEYRLCNKLECPGTGIGFSVYAPVYGTGGGFTTLKFSYVVDNSAGAFNMTTGEFVCRQSGLYFFYQYSSKT